MVTTVNPLYTVDELTFQLKDSKAQYIITLSVFMEKAVQAAQSVGTVKEIFSFDAYPTADSSPILISPFANLMTHESTKSPPSFQVNPKEDVILLPYSSGTTGKIPPEISLTHVLIQDFLKELPLLIIT